MLDVRAPSEFAHGRMPGSTNLPILDDDERMQVGTAYKQEGHESAMALGHRLVSGPRRQHRIDEWIEQCRSHPETQVMCWRGGERSRLAQQWLAEAGFQQQRVDQSRMGQQRNNNGRKVHGNLGNLGQAQGRSKLGH